MKIVVVPFVLAEKGEDCPATYEEIDAATTCQDVCDSLGIPLVSNLNKFKDGNSCYQAGNGKCRQDGAQNPLNVYLVCCHQCK